MATAVADGLAAASASFLLIGGSADPAWDSARARSFGRGEVLEIADADHALQVPGDVARSIDALRRISSAVEDFIGVVDGAGTEHVLLALLEDSNGIAGGVAARLDLTDRLRDGVLSVMDSPGYSGSPRS